MPSTDEALFKSSDECQGVIELNGDRAGIVYVIYLYVIDFKTVLL